MKYKLAIPIILLSSLFCIRGAIADPVNNLLRIKDVISAGSGYSNDSQQITPEQCYNATELQGTDQESKLSLQTAMSFSDLQRELNYSVDSSGGIGTFSYDAEASYLREVEDKDYSFSLNYYSYADVTSAVQISGQGLAALTTTGQSFYNDGKNPYFGIICGDNYVSQFKKGALLAMALNIKFSSHYDKEQFEAHAGASFADIFSAAGQIQQIAISNNIHGSVLIEAYQVGGEPSQLSQLLQPDPKTGKFYVLRCDIRDMDDCVKTADGMLNYASKLFPAQFSFEDKRNLATLSSGFSKYEPIRYIGLIAPPSLVTQQVAQDRDQLTAQLKQVQYYQDNLMGLSAGYPVTWDETSSMYQEIQKLVQQSADNINAIYGPASNPNLGAMGCFNTPDNCDVVFQVIQSHLNLIKPDDLKFLQPIQYYYTGDGMASYFYNGSNYGHANNPDAIDQVDYMYSDYDFTNPNNIHYSVHSTATTDHKQWDWQFTNGVLQPDGRTINMLLSGGPGPRDHVHVQISRLVSPYYFTDPQVKKDG